MRQFRNEAFVLSLVLICVEGIVRTLSAWVVGLVPRLCLEFVGVAVLEDCSDFQCRGCRSCTECCSDFKCRGCRACTKVYLDFLGAGVAGLAPRVARICSNML